MSQPRRVEHEVEPRVRNIEQQMQEKLPHEWRMFAGPTMRMTYYDKQINTFRENPHVEPTAAYMRWAIAQLRAHLEPAKAVLLDDKELAEIVRHEWRTDMTKSVWKARLNRHDSNDGPVVRRSKSGAIYVTARPQPGEHFVEDGMSAPSKASTASTISKQTMQQ